MNGNLGRYSVELDAARRSIVTRALRESRGNKAAAARALGLKRESFFAIIKRLSIVTRATP